MLPCLFRAVRRRCGSNRMIYGVYTPLEAIASPVEIENEPVMR